MPPVAHSSRFVRRAATDAPSALRALSRREPPLHVLVAWWLAHGWEVDQEVLDEAAQARSADRLSLRDPKSDGQMRALVAALPPGQRSYARWLWRKCASDPPERLAAALDSMFMGAHHANLLGADELLGALEDLVRWRLHYDDFEPEGAAPWG